MVVYQLVSSSYARFHCCLDFPYFCSNFTHYALRFRLALMPCTHGTMLVVFQSWTSFGFIPVLYDHAALLYHWLTCKMIYVELLEHARMMQPGWRAGKASRGHDTDTDMLCLDRHFIVTMCTGRTKSFILTTISIVSSTIFLLLPSCLCVLFDELSISQQPALSSLLCCLLQTQPSSL